MGSFLKKVSIKYPDVKWTGESPVHVSKADVVLVATGTEVRGVLSQLIDGEIPKKLWVGLNKYLPMEWLVSEKEFKDLMVVDLYKQLKGEGPLKTDDQIQNPTTGNWYHFIGMSDDYVGGIRFWPVTGYSSTAFCFRFRIQERVESKGSTRRRARTLVEGVREKAEVVYQELMEFSEPPIGQATPVMLIE